ncbi:hypothetical protein MBLNU457_5404t1 [Dothideomycetes sp. NU457]
MTRTLPWLKGSTGGSSTTTNGTSTAQRVSNNTPKRRRLTTPSLSGDDLNTTGVSTPQRKARLRKSTTPSTPSFAAPPEQEPMREGYAADDLWIMVEDEFLATAKLFTQHLHHAEYQRLKKQAEENRAGNIARPVDGRTALPAFVKRERGRKQQDNKITRVEDDADDKDPWLHDPLLGALMDSPTKPKQLLTTSGPGRSTTRAAAGFLSTSQESPAGLRSKQPPASTGTFNKTTNTTRQGQATEREERAVDSDTMDEDDSDDLDKPVRKTKPVVKRETRPPSPVKSSTAAKPRAKVPSSTSSIFARYARRSPSPVRMRKSHSSTDTKQTAKEPKTEYDVSVSQAGKMSRAEMRAALRARSAFKFDSFGEDVEPRKKHTTPAADILAKRIIKLEKAQKQDSNITKDTTATKRRPSTTIEIPTFLDL